MRRKVRCATLSDSEYIEELYSSSNLFRTCVPRPASQLVPVVPLWRSTSWQGSQTWPEEVAEGTCLPATSQQTTRVSTDQLLCVVRMIVVVYRTFWGMYKQCPTLPLRQCGVCTALVDTFSDNCTTPIKCSRPLVNVTVQSIVATAAVH